MQRAYLGIYICPIIHKKNVLKMIHTEQLNDYTINILVDESCESPLQYEGLVIIAGFSRRANYGNYQGSESPEQLLAQLKRERAEYMALYKYEHSGVALSVTAFHCRWDSGQIGWAWISPEFGRAEWGRKWRAKARKYIAAVVETYGQWCNGETYGYEVLDANGNEVASCWGYIGLDAAIESAKDNIPQIGA